MKNVVQKAVGIWVIGSAVSISCFAQDVNRANQVKYAFTEAINDSVTVQVNLRYDAQGLPDHYHCHVNTPVCEHGQCKLMVIDLYWDVLGNFLKYEMPPGTPLTKFDHQEFTDEDHEKLYGILADRASILRDYPVEDLVDRRLIRKSDVVDAVSAATRIEIQDAIVGGAAYSSYALWHIVNGRIAFQIEAHSAPMLNEALLLKMFMSHNVHYQYFALNHFAGDEMQKYIPHIIHLVTEGLSYIPYFAIEKLPDAVWADHQYQVLLLQHFDKSDFKLQNAMLDKIADVTLSVEALDLFVSATENITEKQLRKALEIIRHNREHLSQAARAKLSVYSDHSDETIATETRLLLENARKANKQ